MDLIPKREMRNKTYMLVFFVLSLLASGQAQLSQAAESKEYQIKAAFLYNFIQFVDWPKEKVADSNQPIIIGIIGRDPFGNVFESLKNKKIKGKSVVIRRVKTFEELKKNGELEDKINELKKFHVLFICSSENKNLKQIIDPIKTNNILTVGETDNFLESGGIINFVLEEKKVRFEINLDAANTSKLKISSQLLRLAEKVIQKKEGTEKANK